MTELTATIDPVAEAILSRPTISGSAPNAAASKKTKRLETMIAAAKT